MEQKDKDTELALLQSSADNLSKKLKDRELALSALRESSLLELQDAKLKFKAVKADLLMKYNKEQEDTSKRNEMLRTKLEHTVHILKEELNAKELVSSFEAYFQRLLTKSVISKSPGVEVVGRKNKRSHCF
jgi:hypothetical protein